jgi:hypothetical protein
MNPSKAKSSTTKAKSNMPKGLPEVPDHSAEFGITWNDRPLEAWPPAEPKEVAILRARGEAVVRHLEFLDAHPEIPPSPEEATEGLILKDIIERSKAARI